MIEQELNKLPYTITKNVERICPECGNKHKKQLIYELKMDIVPNDGKIRYRIYYKLQEYIAWNNKLEYIGEYAGLGYPTIKEAIESLKGYL